MKNNLKKPCKDCPFRKNSIPNYIGDRWTAIDLHRFIMSEQHFPCHNTVKEDEVESEEHEHCVGSIMYMNQSGKRCRDKRLAELQEKFRKENHENIMNLIEFNEHHKDAKKLF